jgi:preprotein translocase subunit SecY
MPVLLVNVLPQTGWGDSIRRWIDGNLVQAASPVYLAIFGLLIFGFSYFYTSIAFDPVQQADNLRKQGGFIPGIRPGPQTERYLAKVLNRITFPGALFIAFLALVPTIIVVMIVGRANSGIAFSIGGASLLIAVGVALELMKQVDGQLMLRNYEGFLSSKPEKRR